MRIFVEELPRSCFYCDCCHERYYDPRKRWEGNKFCGIEDIDVDKYYQAFYDDILEKPDWCPLEEIPGKETGADIDDEYDTGYQHGWNEYRKEMLGE